jgi:hypothetical protein
MTIEVGRLKNYEPPLVRNTRGIVKKKKKLFPTRSPKV